MKKIKPQKRGMISEIVNQFSEAVSSMPLSQTWPLSAPGQPFEDRATAEATLRRRFKGGALTMARLGVFGEES